MTKAGLTILFTVLFTFLIIFHPKILAVLGLGIIIWVWVNEFFGDSK